MPFDFGKVPPIETMPTMTRHQVLRRLVGCLRRSGDQSDYATCLWSEVERDRELLKQGMPDDVHGAWDWLLDTYQIDADFGTDSKLRKRFGLFLQQAGLKHYEY